MKKNDLDNVFSNLEGTFDTEETPKGHANRFLNKLNTQTNIVQTPKKNIWLPSIGIAASIAILFSIFTFVNRDNNVPELASISPKMAETESVFNVMLQNELKKVNPEVYPEYQELIVDALFKIKEYEESYNQLIYGLKENPEDQLIISAMILNFQSRIDILQEVMQKIEDAKNSNIKTNII